MNVDITGAKILFELPFGITITETQVNMWGVMLFVFILCKWLTHNLKVRPEGQKQIVAEYLVKTVDKLVKDNMGEGFINFSPFIAAMFSFAAFCSLSSLLGVYPATADLNTPLGWAVLVFILITFYKIKTHGFVKYLKSFTEPVFVMTPMNLISEVATPVSMSFRMFGNIASGVVISTLAYAALAVLSSMVFKWLPGVLGSIPFLQVGLPAILSIYFDLFSSLLQAFIFCMLTMVYIKIAAEKDPA